MADSEADEAGGIAGLATLSPAAAWPALALIAAALGTSRSWTGALFVTGILAALRMERAG